MPSKDSSTEFEHLKREIDDFVAAAEITISSHQDSSVDTSNHTKDRFETTVVDSLELLQKLSTSRASGGFNRRKRFGNNPNTDSQEYQAKLIKVMQSLGRLPQTLAFEEKYGLHKKIQAIQGNETLFDYDTYFLVVSQHHSNQVTKKIARNCTDDILTEEPVLNHLLFEGFSLLKSLENFEKEIAERSIPLAQRFSKQAKDEKGQIEARTASIKTELVSSLKSLKKMNPRLFFDVQSKFDVQTLPVPKTGFDRVLRDFALREHILAIRDLEIVESYEKKKNDALPIQNEIDQIQNAFRMLTGLRRTRKSINDYTVHKVKQGEIKAFRFPPQQHNRLNDIVDSLEEQQLRALKSLRDISPEYYHQFESETYKDLDIKLPSMGIEAIEAQLSVINPATHAIAAIERSSTHIEPTQAKPSPIIPTINPYGVIKFDRTGRLFKVGESSGSQSSNRPQKAEDPKAIDPKAILEQARQSFAEGQRPPSIDLSNEKRKGVLRGV
jgi:hypothetical protein